ncbi:MAG: sporulation protein Cse60 [Bacilli bacterium]
MVIKLKVKVFDEAHEKDLENTVNNFLNSGVFDIIDIKFQVAISVCGEEQLYCFSAMIIYN